MCEIIPLSLLPFLSENPPYMSPGSFKFTASFFIIVVVVVCVCACVFLLTVGQYAISNFEYLVLKHVSLFCSSGWPRTHDVARELLVLLSVAPEH